MQLGVTGVGWTETDTAVARVSRSDVQLDSADVWQVGAGEAGVPLSDGGLLTVGRSPFNFSTQFGSEYDIDLARLDSNLDLVPSFGGSERPFAHAGTAVFDFGDRETANAVAAAPGGKIVAAGIAEADMAVARYEGDAPAPPPTPGGPVVYQAEAAKFAGADVSRSHPGYTGSGFVDFVTTNGAYIEWTVDAPETGFYAFDFRYANGTTSPRTQDFVVNGKFAGYAPFAGTGSWSAWGVQHMTANLVKGPNTVRLQAGFNGPNVDSLTVTPLPAVQVLEAESASMAGAVVASNHPGYTGTGFADFSSPAPAGTSSGRSTPPSCATTLWPSATPTAAPPTGRWRSTSTASGCSTPCRLSRRGRGRTGTSRCWSSASERAHTACASGRSGPRGRTWIR